MLLALLDSSLLPPRLVELLGSEVLLVELCRGAGCSCHLSLGWPVPRDTELLPGALDTKLEQGLAA